MDAEKMEMWITNVMVRFDLKNPVDLLETSKLLDKVEYNPRKFAGLRIRKKNLTHHRHKEEVITLFSSGIGMCSGESEKNCNNAIKWIVNRLKMLKFILPYPVEKKVVNVAVTGDIGRKVGCGGLRILFPNSTVTRFGGESTLIKNGGTIRMFPSGKLVGVGFKSEKEAKERTLEVMEKINKEYDGTFERAKYCRIERYEPTIEEYYKIINQLKFSDEEKIYGEKLITGYLREVRDKALGMDPKSLAAGVIYLSGVLIGKHRSQEELAKTADLAPATIGTSYSKIVHQLGLGFETVW